MSGRDDAEAGGTGTGPGTAGPGVTEPGGGPGVAEPGGGPGVAEPGDGPGVVELGGGLGERATLVQFSSAFCAPCRATRRVLGEVAAMVPGVAHVEIDAEARLDLVRALGILKTPTVLVLDAHGREVRRAAGQPRKADVIAALGEAV
ncbi:thioredoxin family protein [Streptomyces sp. WP-1]|uniref:TlpA family protein disulfide reductase n=1 Tax=Streptomyces sp. WP-1 TaxID=3041497 RepID=UPI0026475492|nr:thioredoxin family protein [Streptomyces sp. WP-1]WKE73099.1 thioredoxin family protein [Streptomyces sp. WP-1]